MGKTVTDKEKMVAAIAHKKRAIRGDGKSPTEGSMGLSKSSKQHPLKKEVRLVILVCFILTLSVLQMHDYQALSK